MDLAEIDRIGQYAAGGPYSYARRSTRVVAAGEAGIGGANPIRVQSMTTTRGLDTEGSVRQTIALVEAGCELVRITTPGVDDAENLREIAGRLRSLGYHVPLIADVHFNPLAAIEAAKWVDKVRINPGNYADSRSSKREYTDVEYAAEIERIEQRLLPLIRICRANGVAMRIGVNHGSLSGRITSRYGDTALGMVESALEFVRACERHDYRELVLSMKSSSPKVMIQAYRLLASRMDAEGMDYPFHLGVTEAGSGVEARVKSAAGIGALLDDGIGDTIRVSLAEDPRAEIPVAIALARMYSGHSVEARPKRRWPVLAPGDNDRNTTESADLRALPAETRDPFAYHRRASRRVEIGGTSLGDGRPPLVIARLDSGIDESSTGRLFEAVLSSTKDLPDLIAVKPRSDAGETAVLVAELAESARARGVPVGVLVVVDSVADLARCLVGAPVWLDVSDGVTSAYPDKASVDNLGALAVENLVDHALALLQSARDDGHKDVLIGVRSSDATTTIRATRLLAARLAKQRDDVPLVISFQVSQANAVALPSGGTLALDVPIAIGGLFADGLGDAVCVSGYRPADNAVHRCDGQAVESQARSLASDVSLALDCLQSVGARYFKAEVVACPGCGRTLFDLSTTTERVKSRFGHLVGVKIAVMGCVVNGPGELADADFGYMGGAPGHVSLYVGQECIERNIPADEADERLVALIKAHNRWIEPGDKTG